MTTIVNACNKKAVDKSTTFKNPVIMLHYSAQSKDWQIPCLTIYNILYLFNSIQ